MEIYTDGSSIGNNSNKISPGGWAYVVVENELETFNKCGNKSSATNNEMELKAMIEALVYVKFNMIEKCMIYTDSNYVHDGINSWSKRWVKNSFKTSTGKLIKNVELWKVLIELKGSVSDDVHIKWVKAHDVNKWNNRVDSLARTSAERMKA